MTGEARACLTMKLNYQSYANSTTLGNQRAAAVTAWVNNKIYLYNFTSRKMKRSPSIFIANLFVPWRGLFLNHWRF